MYSKNPIHRKFFYAVLTVVCSLFVSSCYYKIISKWGNGSIEDVKYYHSQKNSDKKYKRVSYYQNGRKEKIEYSTSPGFIKHYIIWYDNGYKKEERCTRYMDTAPIYDSALKEEVLIAYEIGTHKNWYPNGKIQSIYKSKKSYAKKLFYDSTGKLLKDTIYR